MKLFNYKPRHIFETDEEGQFIEEPCDSTFVVKNLGQLSYNTDVSIEYVSGDKEKWDLMGITNRTTASLTELTELSSIEVVVVMTGASHNENR